MNVNEASTPMTIRYENTFGDIMAFYFYHYPRSPGVFVPYGIGFLIISFVVNRAFRGNASPVAEAIAFLIVELIVLLFLAGLFVVTVVLTVIASRDKTLLTEHTITLTDGSFVEETAYNKTDHNWFGVRKLARTSRHIFIYIGPHAAHVIPRRAFRDETEWNSFYEYCKQRLDTV